MDTRYCPRMWASLLRKMKKRKKFPDSSIHSISLLSATLSKNPILPNPNLKLYTSEKRKNEFRRTASTHKS